MTTDDPTLGGILGTPPHQPTEKVHALPVRGSGLTGCCGRTLFDLPRTDRATELPHLVTCTDTRTTRVGEWGGE